MELRKTYLDSEELVGVVNTLVEIEDPTIREITKCGILYQLLVKDAPELETCNDYFDLYQQGDFDFDCLRSVRLVDKLVDKKLGTTQVIKNFLDDITVKIDELGQNVSDENMNNIMAQFKELSENGSKNI